MKEKGLNVNSSAIDHINLKGALAYVSIERGEWVARGLRGFIRRLFRRDDVVMKSGNWLPLIRETVEVGTFHHDRQATESFDSMSCTTFGTLNAIELLMLAKGSMGRVGRSEMAGRSMAQAPQWSNRYTSFLAGTTRKGNTPQKVAESVRRFGLLPELLLPTWFEGVSWETWGQGVTKALIAKGQTAVRRLKFTHEWLWEERPAADRQLTILREALKYSPVGVAVYGWACGEDGKYVREGRFANHWTLLIAIEDNGDYVVLDSYEPFLKTLRKGYEFEFAKGYGVKLR